MFSDKIFFQAFKGGWYQETWVQDSDHLDGVVMNVDDDDHLTVTMLDWTLQLWDPINCSLTTFT